MEGLGRTVGGSALSPSGRHDRGLLGAIPGQAGRRAGTGLACVPVPLLPEGRIARRRPAGLVRVRLKPDRGIHFAPTAARALHRVGCTEFGYFAYDDAGQPVGDFISGAELLAKRAAAA